VIRTEKEKMLAGEPYRAADAELSAERRRARLLLARFNRLGADPVEAQRLLRELIPGCGHRAHIEPPFYCDYGSQITLGDKAFLNFNCVILDVMPVRIGARTLIGPAVQIYAATHPLSAAERRTGLEGGKSVHVGDDVWIGGGAIICPGVHIGSESVIGAGSVVVGDIPGGVFAAGNPCRVIRRLV